MLRDLYILDPLGWSCLYAEMWDSEEFLLELQQIWEYQHGYVAILSNTTLTF